MSDNMSINKVIKLLPKFFTICVASKRNSGKTVLISAMINELLKQQRVDIVLVISGSAGLNEDYKDVIPSKLIVQYSDSIIDSLWVMNAAKQKNKRQHILVVLDDCLGTPAAFHNPDITKVYALGRHNDMSIIMISQHTSCLLTPIIRGNSDILLFSQLNRYQLKQMWQNTTNISYKDFVAYSEKNCGVDFQFVYIDKINRKTNPNEFLGIVKAPRPRGTKVPL